MRRFAIMLIFFSFMAIHSGCIAQNINALNINLKSEKNRVIGEQPNFHIPQSLVDSSAISYLYVKNRQWATGGDSGIATGTVQSYLAENVFNNKKPILKNKKSSEPIQQRPSFLSLDMNAVWLTKRPLENTAAEGAIASSSIGWGMEGAWFPTKNYGFGGDFNSVVFSSKATQSDLNRNTYGQFLQLFSAEVGQYLSFPLPKNWFITGKLLTGISSLTRKRFGIDEETDNYLYQSREIITRYPSNIAVNWTFGVGVHKMVAKNVAVKAQVNYAISNHKLLIARGTPGQPISWDGGMEKVNVIGDRLSVGLGLSAFLW